MVPIKVFFREKLLMRSQLQDEKACFSRVGKEHHGDYQVSFSDGQQLQKLRHKLFRSTIVLGGIITATNSCRSHCTTIEQALSRPRDSPIILEMSQLIMHFNYCRSVVRNLTESSNGTAELVSQSEPNQRLKNCSDMSCSSSRSAITTLQKSLGAVARLWRPVWSLCGTSRL